ncbi:MAG: DUF1302 family protein [Rubrivivax sp.]
MTRHSHHSKWRHACGAGAALAALASSAQAVEIDTGNPDVSLRWDTTVKYSLASRVGSPDAVYLGPGNANGDDGDRNFGKGIVSNRLDLFTEADLVWQRNFGIRVSGAAYYDDVYNKKNDNPGVAGGAFPNNASVPADEFTKATRDRMGRKAELLDAFVFGKFDLGETKAAFRAGRHALTWGESLFFGSNAIAGGMMPVDAIKLAGVPGTQFKEAIRPVPMLSGTAQLTPRLSLGAYYQFSWQRSILPAAGSYLSTSDILLDGGEQLLVGPTGAPRQADRTPKNSGQGGIQLRWRGDETDFGAYLVRYHEKGPQPVAVLGVVGNAPAPTGYYMAYNEGVTAVALSASRTFGSYNIAAEAGIRRNSSLASSQGVDLSAIAPVPPTDVTGNPGYATGKTAHVNVSVLASLDESWLWREASFAAEVAWNRMLSVMKNPGALDPNSTRDGVALRFVLEPTYRSVAPGVDIGVPVGLGWAPKGSRPYAAGGPPAWIPQNGGDVSVGLNASFRDAWRFTLNYTHYYGSRAPVAVDGIYQWKQALGDRDFIAASARYSF